MKSPMLELLETIKENKDLNYIIEIIENYYLKYERESIAEAFDDGWDCGFAKSLDNHDTGDTYFNKIYPENNN